MQVSPSEIMFPVKEVPAIGIPKEANTKEIDDTGYKFIVREDTGDVMSCMTNEYKLVQNSNVFDTADKIVKKHKGQLKEVKSFGNGARSIMKWHFPNNVVNIVDKDGVTPEIIIRNSYDGTIGVNVQAGAFRLVCANGMVIGVVLENHRNKHSIWNLALDDMEDVITETIEKTEYLFQEEFPILYNTPIKEKHIIELIKLFPTTMSTFTTQKLIADKPKSFWDLFNVATYITSHNMKRENEATHKIEEKIYNRMKKMALNEVARA